MFTALSLRCLAALAFSVAGPATAQDFGRIAPKPVLPPGQTDKEGPREAPPDTIVRVKELKGLVFITDPQAVKRDGVEVSDLDVSRVPALQTEAFKARMSKFLGKPVSLRSIEDLLQEVVDYYTSGDRPFVIVTSPEQDITGGVLQILVIEGKVGDVKITGAKYFDEKIYRNAIGLKAGDPLIKRKLDADIEWLNRNPFREASAFLGPGKAIGTTDVDVRTRERPPVRVYAGYDDTGTKTSGNDRISAGVNWGNVFGLDHQFNYQFTANPSVDRYRAHSATYVAPLAWRHVLTVFGSHADINGNLPAPFSLRGRSEQLGLRYEVPLDKIGGLSHSWIGGLDYKRSNTNLEFGLTNISPSPSEIMQGVLGYQANIVDTLGVTSLSANGYYSPGGSTNSNTDANFQTLRAFAHSHYSYLNLQLQRVTRLPHEFSWHLVAVTQIASGNLLGSEQLGAGGYSTVRGYNEREANGDQGALIRNEVRTPSFNLGAPMPGSHAQVQMLAFVDYGVVRNKRLLPGEASRVELASAGLGMRFSVDQNVTVRFDHGWQLKDDGVVGGRKNSRSHFALLVSY